MPENPAPTEIARSLPALQLNERRSATAVVEISSSFTPRQAAIKEFGNLTFILAPGNKLHLVDDSGREATGFEAINDATIVDWDSIRAGESTDLNGRRYRNANKFTQLSLSRDSYSTSSKCIDDCPAPLQAFLKAYLRSGGSGRTVTMPDSNWKVGDPRQTQQVILGNGFILCHEAEDQTFVAYSTVDPQGQPQEPAAWKRFDNKDEHLKNLPVNIREQIEKLRESNNLWIKAIKNTHGFNILALEDKITIIKSGNRLSQAEFTINIPVVGDNICIDPKDPKVIYYCSSGNASAVFKLKLEGEPSSWKPEAIQIKQAYPQISSLQLDPSGTAFMFETGSEVVLVEKNSFQELKRLPLKKAIFDKQGKIRGVDQQGRFVVIETNLEHISTELERRQVAQMAAGIKVQELFQTPAQTPAESAETGVRTEALLPVRHECEANFLKVLTQAQDLQTVAKSSAVLQVLKDQLLARGFNQDQVDFITQGIAEAIDLRQRVFAQHEAGKMIKALEPRISSAFVSIATIKDLRAELDRLNALSGLLSQETRNQASILTQRFNQQVGELYRREGETIRTDINSRISGVRATLDHMNTRAELSDWRELDLPAIKQDLALLARESPLEAVEVQKQINEARTAIDRMVNTYEDRFRKEYESIRGKAQAVVVERGALIASEVDGFVTRMLERKFGTRETAEQFIANSGTKTLLENDIADLEKQDPERAKVLARELKIKIVNLLGDVERRAKVQSTGQGDLVQFGENTFFPKWAAKTAETPTKKRIDLVFIPPADALRNGARLDQIKGNIGVRVTDSTGKVKTLRLFEGETTETDWQVGLFHKAGIPIPSTIMSGDSFLKLLQDFKDWNKPNSSLKTELGNLRKQLLEHLGKRPRLGQRTERIPGIQQRQAIAGYQDDPVWRKEANSLNQKYAQFVIDHHIMFLNRIDQIQKAPLPEAINGKGLVAKWNTGWTRDEYTEEKLEEIVKYMKMQLHQQKGVIMLKGHAGTGKDVCVDMTSALLERPLFAFNCSKWTTEEDLTEVLLLDVDVEAGAPKSVKIPSSVLTGIQTEGAMVYFNEFNALPPPTQLFLHSLADHKRSLMLKTSGGKIIKTRSTVTLLASINEGPLYEGTNPIQPATRSRMTFIDFDYTPLIGKRREGDPNPNPSYSSAGALRIAREIKSLEDFTLENNMERNEFVKIWDAYVNKIARGVDLSKLTPTQKYDLEVILCLVQWGDKLNKAFAQQADGKATANDLPVMIPLTGREMSSMAYWLSEETSDRDKEEGLVPGKETYEKTARALIERFFLSKLTDENQKDEIRRKIQVWTSQKRT